MIELVIEARRRRLGDFEVGRVLPHLRCPMVGPFIFWDHMGPMNFPPDIPRTADVRPHPHIGLATITYLFEGEIVHRDSVGATQVIRPGEVNWMTAGSGITHSERFDTMRATGGRIEGIQSWIALPLEHEEIAPEFIHCDAGQLPRVSRDGATLQVIAGSAFGVRSAVPILSPLLYVHVELEPDAWFEVPQEYSERALYIVRGSLQADGETYGAGRMLVLSKGAEARVGAHEHVTLMLLAGEPVGARHIWWNFVSSSRERIERAKDDWRQRRMPMPIDDAAEFIPLPED